MDLTPVLGISKLSREHRYHDVRVYLPYVSYLRTAIVTDRSGLMERDMCRTESFQTQIKNPEICVQKTMFLRRNRDQNERDQSQWMSAQFTIDLYI